MGIFPGAAPDCFYLWHYFFSFLRNLQAFNTAIVANEPLLQIEVVLSVSEITLQPNASEMEKMILQSIQDCVEVTKVIFDKDFFLFPEFAYDYDELILCLAKRKCQRGD